MLTKESLLEKMAPFFTRENAYFLTAVGASLYFLRRFFFAGKKVQEKEYKKDCVYLFQFPRAQTLPSVSPFCLKLETFLRVNKIPYENRFLVTGRSEHGLLPFIELNGEQIADSQIICERLTKHFNVTLLSDKQEALSRAVARMLEGHTFYIFYKYKILDRTWQFVSHLASDIGVPGFLKPLVLPIMTVMFKRTAVRRIGGSLGMFSEEEFDMLFRKDLDSLAAILGNKRFLFGDSMSTVDCGDDADDEQIQADYSAFGILATGAYLPFETKISQALKQDYPELLKYCERIRHMAFENDFTK